MLCVNNWLHGKSEVRHQREKKRCVGSCSEGRARGNQWVIEHVGERWMFGGVSVTPTQNSQYWPEQLRTEQVSFLLLLLLCAPAEASHGATCDSQHHPQNTRWWSSESTWAPPAWLTARHNQGQDENRNTHFFFHPQTTVEWTLEHKRRRDKYVSRSPSWNMLFLCSCCNTGARLCVRKKGHHSALANVDKGFIVEGGECQTNRTAAGLLEPALLTCSDRQDQENVVV